MAWGHPLFQRQTFRYRPISLIVLVTTCAIVFLLVAIWLHSPAVHAPSQNETKAIEAAWAKCSGKEGGSPDTGTTVIATKLKGAGWIVQFERTDREIESYSLITYYVGPDFSCQWLSVVSH